MKIFKRPNGKREGFASLANIGYDLYEVNLEGEVYRCATSRRSMRYKAERVGSNKWKIYARDASGNMIEQVMRTDVLVGCAWCNVDESLWENSTYADTIHRCKEFFSIPNEDIAKTDYQTSKGFYYYVTRYGEVWSTENMIKLKADINDNGYRYVKLGSAPNVRVHRLVARHFVHVPEDLVDQGLIEESLVVNHLDGNKLNNRWDNLEWTTNEGNMAHASATGLMSTTIDDQLLEHVFKRLQEGYSDINISKETGIPVKTVSAIRQGKSRRYITDEYTWSKSSVDARMKERRELAIKCDEMYNQGMSQQAIADKLGFISRSSVARLIDTCKDLVTRKPPRKLDKDTIFSIYDEFTYTDKNNCEIGRQYNVDNSFISKLRLGHRCSDLAREYVTSKGLAGYWQGFRHPK